MGAWHTVTGDDAVSLVMTLLDDDGTAVDITAAVSANLLVKAEGATGAATVFACTLTTPASGIVTAVPTFASSGKYNGEVEVTFGDGSTRTFPTNGVLNITVRQGLN